MQACKSRFPKMRCAIRRGSGCLTRTMKSSLPLLASIFVLTVALPVSRAADSASATCDCPVFALSEIDQAPKPLRQSPPSYPGELKAAGVSGEAIISFVVDPAGNTRDVQSLRETRAEFAQAAIAAIQQWVFTPATKNNRAVACRIQVPIVFSLAK